MKIKIFFLIALLATALYILQTYWAMGAYFNDLSTGCLDCSIWVELIFNSVVQLLIIILFLQIAGVLKSKKAGRLAVHPSCCVAFGYL